MPMSLTSTSGRSSSTARSASALVANVLTSAPYCTSETRRKSRTSVSSSTTITFTPSRRTSHSGSSPSLLGSHAAAASGGAGRGRRTVKVEPWPDPRLSACTVPPCSSTRCRTMARPKPMPPCFRVVLLSACQKRSNA